MKLDYEELEGKQITIVDSYGDSETCIVVGVSYHVGITVVQKSNTNNKRICLNRKIHARGEGYQTRANYRKRFQLTVKAIQAGKYYIGDMGKAIGRRPQGSGMASCAFGS